ncbi:hypothetical protein K523DRAFT_325402 [Schizophyllum commune Tattone D]|nr:hypothetical protein K523DRAFT_325402 [Schizophyllum commune Tattone D]
MGRGKMVAVAGSMMILRAAALRVGMAGMGAEVADRMDPSCEAVAVVGSTCLL